MGKFLNRLSDELSLYVRHAAWLQAARVVTTKTGQAKKPSRLAELIQQGIDPDRPPIDAHYLVDYLFDAGPVLAGGMAITALDHVALLAWQQNTGIHLNPWQVRTLRHLSGEYAAMLTDANEPDCPSPWQPEIEEPDRSEVGKKVQTALRTLMSTRPKNASRNT